MIINAKLYARLSDRLASFVKFQCIKIRFLVHGKILVVSKVKSNKQSNYSGKVYNFAVEDDESYICNNIIVHNCVCGVFKPKTMPDIIKSLHLKKIPKRGNVKLDTANNSADSMISTGEKWVRMNSVEGRAVIQDILMHTPFFKYGGEFCHGHLPKSWRDHKSKISAYHFNKVSSPTFEIPIGNIVKSYSLEEYITLVKNQLPLIAQMPNFWETKKVRFMTDFLGFGDIGDIRVRAQAETKDAKLKSLQGKTGIETSRKMAKECDCCH